MIISDTLISKIQPKSINTSMYQIPTKPHHHFSFLQEMKLYNQICLELTG